MLWQLHLLAIRKSFAHHSREKPYQHLTSSLNFYKQDAVPVTQPTVSKHWRNSLWMEYVGKENVVVGRDKKNGCYVLAHNNCRKCVLHFPASNYSFIVSQLLMFSKSTRRLQFHRKVVFVIVRLVAIMSIFMLQYYTDVAHCLSDNEQWCIICKSNLTYIHVKDTGRRELQGFDSCVPLLTNRDTTHNCFTALWILSGTTRMSRYQKKHSPTHTYRGHQSSLICFLHLLWSMASCLFNLCVWQSFSTIYVQVFFGLPLSLTPSTSYSIHLFTNHCLLFAAHAHTINLFCCSTNIVI